MTDVDRFWRTPRPTIAAQFVLTEIITASWSSRPGAVVKFWKQKWRLYFSIQQRVGRETPICCSLTELLISATSAGVFEMFFNDALSRLQSRS